MYYQFALALGVAGTIKSLLYLCIVYMPNLVSFAFVIVEILAFIQTFAQKKITEMGKTVATPRKQFVDSATPTFAYDIP